MGEKDLFDYWSDTFKVHSLEWNQEVAASILSQWQAKFTEEVLVLIEEKQFHRKYEINAFSSFYLNDILAQFSEVNWIKVTIGYVIMVRPAVVLCLHTTNMYSINQKAHAPTRQIQTALCYTFIGLNYVPELVSK